MTKQVDRQEVKNAAKNPRVPKQILIGFALVIVAYYVGVSSPAPLGAAVAATEVMSVSQDTSQHNWERIVAEAKKEGSIGLYYTWPAKIRALLIDSFQKRYGIHVQFSPMSRAAELLAKLHAEQSAGLYLADVFGVGTTTLTSSMKREGLLGPIKPLLMLPEVRDSKAWKGGKLPFVDKEGRVFAMIGTVKHEVAYNPNLIRDGEITTLKNLLKPQYKGKITLNDPSITGAGNAFFSSISELWGEAQATEFLRELLRKQDAVIVRDKRTHVESVVRGKYAIALAPNEGNVTEFLALGAPIKIAVVEEDTRLTAATGAFGVPTKFAHPNAAIVFLNWLLTKEGQSAIATSHGLPSMRTDVSVEGINPIYTPLPGKNYFIETEESLLKKGKLLKVAKKVMEENIK